MRFDSKNIVLLAVFFVLAAIYLLSDFRAVHDAGATGGAFTSGATKHGGGTVDGDSYEGVNRILTGDDFGGFYYSDLAGEAGEYEPGECMHCHEPHQSFGTTEPPPVEAGLNDFLLFQSGASNSFCWSCHEMMDVGYDPMEAPFGYGMWGFYQGQTNFESSSHGVSGSFVWPGGSDLQSPFSTWPRDYVRTSSEKNMCVNCHTPHGVAGSFDTSGTAPAAGNYIVGAVTLSTIPRQTIAREEALCLNCHDGTPANAGGTISTTSVKEEIDYYLSTTGSGHPVRSSSYFNKHNLSKETDDFTGTPGRVKGWLNTIGAHAECTDCHNPHTAKGYGFNSGTYPSPQRGTVFQWSGTSSVHAGRQGDASGVYIGPVNRGVWGVGVNTSTGDVLDADVINELLDYDDASPSYLYNLCLKCHSAWAWNDSTGTNTNQPTAPSTTGKSWTVNVPASQKMTDVAYQFVASSTVNNSWHPVFGAGRNQPSTGLNVRWTAGAAGTRTDGAPMDLSQNFVPPWEADSIITCVDCHSADTIGSGGGIARGPHGSSAPFILRKLDPLISYTVNTGGNLTNGDVDYDSDVPSCGSTAGGTAFTPCGADRTSVNLTTAQETNNIFCLNCHRADIYGWDGSGQATNEPYFYLFPRQRHPVDWGNGAMRTLDSTKYGGGPRNGIVCMSCHGGGSLNLGGTGGGRLALIHGVENTVTSNVSTAGHIAGRVFIAGSVWLGYKPGMTGTFMFCGPSSDAWGGCTQHGSVTQGAELSSKTYSNYNYTAP